MSILDQYINLKNMGISDGAAATLAAAMSVDENEGEIHVAHGDHSITIETLATPAEVWLSLVDGAQPVCGAGQNCASVMLGEFNFVIHASIATNGAVIRYRYSL